MVTTNLKYYDVMAFQPVPIDSKTKHSEFLRNGSIKRFEDRWLPTGKRYYSHEEVAKITSKRLTTAGRSAQDRLNNFHPSIQFPDILFNRTIENYPHLGYCHVTSSECRINAKKNLFWSFYLANFDADINAEENAFKVISPKFSRMYFAVALDPSDKSKLQINVKAKNNGVLFKTNDPKQAMKNVLYLGAKNEALRKFVYAS